MSNTKIKAGQFSGIVGNGTDGYFLMTNGDGTMAWEPAGAPSPTVTSVTYPGDDTAADPAGGQSVTLNGTNFATGATVTIGGTTAPTVSFVSATELTITTPAKAAGDYDIVITNTDGGTATFVDGISYNGIPSWTTASGSLGTFASDTTISTITLQASEPDAGTITFNITSGALPTGLSLTGADIDGTTSKETADTLYNFTVTAIDDENQSTPRAFSITVEKYIVPAPENFEIVTYTGNGGTQAITSKIGKAASFNGSSSRINYSSIFTGEEIRSYSFWFNTDSNNTGTVFISGGKLQFNIDPDATNSVTIFKWKNGQSQFITGTPNNMRQGVANPTINLNQWYHGVVIMSSTANDDFSFYLNGSQVTLTYSDNYTAGYTNDGDWIGTNGRYQNVYYNNFSGKIDQVRIFNKALSSGEVTTLYGETYASSTKSTTDIFGDGSGVALYELDDSADTTPYYPYGTGAIDSGQSAVFNGSSSKLQLPSNVSVATGNNDFTLSSWVYLNSMPSIFASVITTQDNYYFYITISSDGKVRTYNQNIVVESAAGVISAGNWYHIVATLDSTIGKNVYVNGINVATSSNTSNCNSFTNGQNAVGYYNSGGIDEYHLNGKIDQIRIYNTALSPSDVVNLVSETNVPTANLVAHYKLDGNALDETTNYNGTATNVTYSDPAEFPNIAYNGTATNVNFLGMAFQPDLVWVKSRSGAYNAVIFDSVRTVGGNKELTPSETYAEGGGNSSLYGYISTLDSNGFTLTAGSTNSLLTNNNADTYVAWCWKAGGAAVSNTDGTITSQVSANQDAGFSIVSYTGTSSLGTVGHGLSSAPELYITKYRDSGSYGWYVYDAVNTATNYMRLNTTAGSSAYEPLFNNTEPTSTVFTVDNYAGNNNSGGNYITYCFHSVDGYQKVGYWQGGTTTITLGFRPRFILLKDYATGGGWGIWDSNRGNYSLSANTSSAEVPSTFITATDTGFTVPSESSIVYRLYLAIA